MQFRVLNGAWHTNNTNFIFSLRIEHSDELTTILELNQCMAMRMTMVLVPGTPSYVSKKNKCSSV